jgi:hypothetical protein
MADTLELTQGGATLTEPGNVSTHVFVQKTDFVDLSGYDQVDLQCFLYGVTGSGDVIFTLLTSMHSKDDPSLWQELGSLTLTLGSNGEPASDAVTLPLSVLATTTATTRPKPLLRYVRWQVEFTGTVTSAQIEILGLVRRRSL